MVFQLFPEAVMHQRPPFFPLLILGLAYFAMGITALAVIGALPTIAQGLAGPQADVANAVAAFAITFALAAPTIQILFSSVPRRTLLLGGLGLMALGVLLSTLASSTMWFIGARVLAALGAAAVGPVARSEEHTSELQSLMRISYAVFCLKKKKT